MTAIAIAEIYQEIYIPDIVVVTPVNKNKSGIKNGCTNSFNIKVRVKRLLLLASINTFTNISLHVSSLITLYDRRGRDRMVIGFTTTCAISAYRH